MPPKNLSIIINGVDTALMTREGLERFCLTLKDELDNTRQERNFYQTERDKLRTYWEISRNEYEEVRAKILILERETEESQEDNNDLLDTEKQRFKSLQYDLESTFTALKAENQLDLKAAKVKHDENEQEIYKDKRALKTKMREFNAAAQDELRRAKAAQADELAKTKKELEERAKRIEDTAAKKLEETKYELTVKHRAELACIEERKNKQLSELSIFHQKSFEELKLYYNDITLNNLCLIKSLKDKIEELNQAKLQAEMLTKNMKYEAKGLIEPLEDAKAINNELKRQMSNYDREKAALATYTKQVVIVKKDYENLKIDYEALENRLEREIAERNELKDKFPKSVTEVQEKALEKANIIEAKLQNMKIRSMNPIEHVMLLERKQTLVDDLRFEAARLRKAHNDLLATYESKLAKLGVPSEELGFKPLRAVPLEGALPLTDGMGPANLVTKNLNFRRNV